jgi:hypothetical protein
LEELGHRLLGEGAAVADDLFAVHVEQGRSARAEKEHPVEGEDGALGNSHRNLLHRHVSPRVKDLGPNTLST